MYYKVYVYAYACMYAYSTSFLLHGGSMLNWLCGLLFPVRKPYIVTDEDLCIQSYPEGDW